MSKITDTLKQPESELPDFSSFTDEQVDAVVIYIAKLARETRDEHGLSDAEVTARTAKIMKIIKSWPQSFADRVHIRVIEAGKSKNNFWAVPADAMIAATKAIELG